MPPGSSSASQAAYRYDDPGYLARQAMFACSVLAIEPTAGNALRVATIIHEGLPDLIRMPGPALLQVQPSVK